MDISKKMDISKNLAKPVLAVAAAVLLCAGAGSGLAMADSTFLDPFDPDYPSGGVYTTMRGGIITGPSNNTTRCSADLESAHLFALGIETLVVTAAQLACDQSMVCVPVAAANALLALAVFQADACALQDGLIDAAEIEAGYENTVKLIALNTRIYESQMEVNLLNCTNVIGFILPEADGGLAEWVAELVQDRIDDYTPVTSDPDRIVAAQDLLDDGNVAFLDSRFEDAYNGYCKAYSRLQGGKGRG